jgi:hypothetical protein
MDLDTLIDGGVVVEDAAGLPVAGKLSMQASASGQYDRGAIQFRPTVPFSIGIYTVRVTPSAQDRAGNAISNPTVFSIFVR